MPEFWDGRFRTGRTPWDLGRVPSRLERWLAAHPGPGRALLPGCGSGWELAAFVRAGYDALALDFAPAAVARVREVLGPEFAERVVLGDFFTHDFGAPGFDVIYERTFLCALPPRLRADYLRRTRELLRPGGVLLGFFYLGAEAGGPPYALYPPDDATLWTGAFECTVDEESPDALPLFSPGERWREFRLFGAGG